MQYNELLIQALLAAIKAGKAILEIYNSDMDFSVEAKSDNSPLTIADKKSHEVITEILSGAGRIPILSEEGRTIPYSERSQWDMFWLIDPLDGTKEFIKRNDEFTVNIALIHQNRPVLGVVYVPVTGVCYFSADGLGAYKLVDSIMWIEDGKSPYSLETIIGNSKKLPSVNNQSPYTIVASRSHMNKETEDFIERLKEEHGDIELVSAGSSLKLCHVAEGRANIYPRLGPTMEWDTAAAHAVARGAGKTVKVFDSDEELSYNKENLLNPWFVVR